MDAAAKVTRKSNYAVVNRINLRMHADVVKQLRADQLDDLDLVEAVTKHFGAQGLVVNTRANANPPSTTVTVETKAAAALRAGVTGAGRIPRDQHAIFATPELVAKVRRMIAEGLTEDQIRARLTAA